MTNEQILQKAIEKAIKNGWYTFNHDPIFIIIIYDGLNKNGYVEDSDDFNYYGIAFNAPNEESIIYHPRDIIFSHEFAKAFWGISEMKNCKYPDCDETCLAMWQWHLQQMVLEEDPIKYLEKFL